MIDLDRLERAEALAAIKTGLDQIKRGEKIPIEEAGGRLRKKHGFRPHE